MNALLAVEAVERETVIYCRISRDKDDGAGSKLGVTRQRNECTAFAGMLGHTVDRVYVDNNRSAKAGSHRPAFLDLVADIRDGRVAVVIAWHFDRITRNDEDFATFMAICKTHGVKVRMKTSGDLDLDTPSGRLFARQQASYAIYEIEHKGERMTSKHNELAEAGKPNGGPRRFGYNHDMSVRPEEAAIIRELADRVLAGESLASLARDLDARGVLTVSMQRHLERVAAGIEPDPDARKPAESWAPSAVKRVLTGQHVIGHRTHHGVVTKRDAWPAVLDADRWLAVRKVLNDPDRKTRDANDNAVKYLLVGIATCDECGGSMGSGRNGPNAKGERQRMYRCDDCGTSRVAEPVDALVSDVVVEFLATLDPSGLVVAGSGASPVAQLQTEQAELEQRLDVIAEAVADATMTPAMAQRASTKVEARLTDVQHALAEAIADAEDERRRPVRVLAGATGPDAAAVWATLPLARQRAIIGLLLDVRITRGERGKRIVVADAVKVVPKPLA